MTELEIAKLVAFNLPTVAIAVGVAKIYLKVKAFVNTITEQVQRNSDDNEMLIELHIKNHGVDEVEIYKRRARKENGQY